VFENRVLRRILGHKREEVVGGWKRLPNEVKVKLSLCFNLAPHHGGVLSGGIAPRFLDLGTRWK
jgi:hypothetical protein